MDPQYLRMDPQYDVPCAKDAKKLDGIIKLLTKNYLKTTFALPYEKVIWLLDLTLEFYKKYPIGVVETTGNAAILGDTHGDFQTLYTGLNYLLFESDKLLLKKNLKIILLGDYVDRGKQGLRGVLLLFALKMLRPCQFFPYRGNHETSYINKKQGFFAELTEIFPNKATDLHAKVNKIFEYLPFVGTHNHEVLLMHGGISSGMCSMEQLKAIKLPISNPKISEPIVQEILWNDPNPKTAVDYVDDKPEYEENGQRKTGKLFNKAALVQIMKKFRVKLVVRGHQAVRDGLEFYWRRLLTVFSASHYTDKKYISSVTILDDKGHIKTVQFVPEGYDPDAVDEEDELTKEETEASKPSKVQPTINKKAALTTIATVAALVCVFGYASFGTADKVSPIVQRSAMIIDSAFAEKSGMIARVLNGMALSSGPFDERKLVGELFPLESGGVVSDATRLKMYDFPKDLNAIQSVIGKECSGSNGCKVSDSLGDGLREIKKLDKDLDDGANDLSAMETVYKVVKELSKLKQENTTLLLIGKIQKMVEKIPDDNSYEPDTITTVGAAHDIADKFSQLLNNSKAISFGGFLASKQKALFGKLWSNIQLLENGLKGENKRFGRLADLRVTVSANQIMERIYLLINLHLSPNVDRQLTYGFLNGVKDIESLKNDCEDKWLVHLLNPEKDLSMLSPKLEPLSVKAKKFDSLSKAWIELEKVRDFRALKSLRNLVNGSVDYFSLSHSRLDECLKSLKPAGDLQSDLSQLMKDIGAVESHITKFKATFSPLFGNYTLFLPPLLKTMHFLTTSKNLTETYETLRSLKTANTIVPSLQNFDASLKAMDLDSIENLLKPLITDKTDKTINSFKKWLDQTMSSVCFKNLLSEIENPNPEVEKLKELGTDSKTVDSVVRHSQALVTTIQEFNKANSAISRRSKRAVSAVPDEKTFLERSKEFGAFVSAIYQVMMAKKLEGDLKTVIANKKMIDSAIEAVSDPEEKANLERLWNANVFKSLNVLLKATEEIEGKIMDVNELDRIQKFSDPFEVVVNLANVEIDLRSLAKALEEKIPDQSLTKSLISLKSLDQLKFAELNEDQIVELLIDLDDYLNAFFGLQIIAVSVDEILIVFSVLMSLPFVVACVTLIVQYRRYKKEEKAKAEALAKVVTKTEGSTVASSSADSGKTPNTGCSSSVGTQ